MFIAKGVIYCSLSSLDLLFTGYLNIRVTLHFEALFVNNENADKNLVNYIQKRIPVYS